MSTSLTMTMSPSMSLSCFGDIILYEVEDRRMRRRRNMQAYARRCATLPWPTGPSLTLVTRSEFP